MTKKAFVLLSGGMDSTTCLFQAINDYCPPDLSHAYADENVLREVLHVALHPEDGNPNGPELPDIDWVEAVSINYGQRHEKELIMAAKLCARLNIEHRIINIGDLLSGVGVMLTSRDIEVPDIDYADIKGVSPTYVPFRNGLMLSVLTAHAQKWVNLEQAAADQEAQDGLTPGAEKAQAGIYFGAHSEDAHNWAYPDCTPEFIGAMANAIHVGSYYAIRLHTPLEWLSKADVVTLGDKLGVPFGDTWSCYKGDELHCGTCPTCRSRKDAFKVAGVVDPTRYKVDDGAHQ